jgi:hypothetical protein
VIQAAASSAAGGSARPLPPGGVGRKRISNLP